MFLLFNLKKKLIHLTDDVLEKNNLIFFSVYPQMKCSNTLMF